MPAAFEVRFVTNNLNIRHLEVFYNNTWNRICYRSTWKKEEATVVCRQLQLPNNGAASFSHTVYSENVESEPIVLDGIQCIGNEESIGQCLPSGFGIHTNCRMKYDDHGAMETYDEVGVVCTNGKKLV